MRLLTAPLIKNRTPHAFAKSTQGYSHVLTDYQQRMMSGIRIIERFQFVEAAVFDPLGVLSN